MTAVLADPLREVERILGEATRRGTPVRAVGGLAVALRSPTIATLEPPRTYHDIDLAAPAGRPDVSALLVDLGYAAERRFNTLNGAERLLFHDPDGRRVDVFVDTLRMCHTLPFRDRLEVDPLTLPLADLLLSKLQIVELTPRDEQDVLALLADHPLAPGDRDGISLPRLEAVCGTDWGWWKTVDGNLERLIGRWSPTADGDVAAPDPEPDGGAGSGAPAARTGGPNVAAASSAIERARELRAALSACPKTAIWRARALIGTRLRWYEEPEEVR